MARILFFVLTVSSNFFYTHPYVESSCIRVLTRSSRFGQPVCLQYLIEMIPVSEAVKEQLC